MNIKLFGVLFYVSPLFFLVLTAMLLIDKTGTALPILSAMFIHECGHLAVMKAVGQDIKRIKLIPSAIIVEGRTLPYLREDLAVTVAGVAANILFAVLFYLLYFLFGKAVFTLYSAANLVVALYNLFPVKGLDGGKILHIFFMKKSRYPERNLKIVSYVFSAALFIGGLILLNLQYINITLIFFSLYIFLTALIKV